MKSRSLQFSVNVWQDGAEAWARVELRDCLWRCIVRCIVPGFLFPPPPPMGKFPGMVVLGCSCFGSRSAPDSTSHRGQLRSVAGAHQCHGLPQGVRYAGLRRVENQGEAEQSTDAAFRARGILPAVFTTSGEGTRGFIRTLYDKKSDVYMMSIRFYMVLIFCLLFNTYCFKCDLKYDAVFCFTYVRTYMICYTYDHSF